MSSRTGLKKYDKRCIRGGGTPIHLTYDPFPTDDHVSENIYRLLKDLLTWLLEGKLNHRTVSAARGLVETWLHAANLPELERRIQEIEEQQKQLQYRHPEIFRTQPGLKDQA